MASACLSRALGITCIEIAQGTPPYANEDSLSALNKIIKNDSPSLDTFEAWNEPLRPFVRLCLQKEPENRPSAEALLKSCKDLWEKAKDSTYLVRALKLDHPILNSSKSLDIALAEDRHPSLDGTLASQLPRDSDSTRSSSIRWDFELGEEET